MTPRWIDTETTFRVSNPPPLVRLEGEMLLVTVLCLLGSVLATVQAARAVRRAELDVR